MKLTIVSLTLASICFLSNSYAMHNNSTKQVFENSLENLLEAKRCVGKAEGLLGCMHVMIVLADFPTPEKKIDYINTEKGKATVLAHQAVPFVKAVKNDCNNDVQAVEVSEICKRIEKIIK
jgi:hypothetical protein